VGSTRHCPVTEMFTSCFTEVCSIDYGCGSRRPWKIHHMPTYLDFLHTLSCIMIYFGDFKLVKQCLEACQNVGLNVSCILIYFGDFKFCEIFSGSMPKCRI